jgi:GTPase SAR1 family protein
MGNQVNFKSESEAPPSSPQEDRKKFTGSSTNIMPKLTFGTKILLLGTGYSGKTTTYYQVFSRYHDNTDPAFVNQFIARVRFNCYDIALNIITYCNLDTNESRSIQNNYNSKKYQNTQDFLETTKDLDPITKVPKQVPRDCTDLFRELLAFYSQTGMDDYFEKIKNSPLWFDGAE